MLIEKCGITREINKKHWERFKGYGYKPVETPEQKANVGQIDDAEETPEQEEITEGKANGRGSKRGSKGTDGEG